MEHACHRRFWAAAFLLLAGPAAWSQSPSASATTTDIRLYVLDGGVLESDPSRYDLTEADVATTELSIASYLIVHPDGVLLWDAGAVADSERISRDSGPVQRLVRTDRQERFVTLGPPLEAQLVAAGFAPSDVTHLALSHYHWDHTANANLFADALWLARPADRDAMFVSEPPGGTRPATYTALEHARTVLITDDEYDVFGDGTVILKSAPGHTEGHQVLYVKLARTGGVVLSGDLYHYPAERRLGRVPSFEVDAAQTARARRDVETFLTEHDAELWIGHDLTGHRMRKHAPAYYD
jgi:N-acyl homoserine lactone hydrolase